MPFAGVGGTSIRGGYAIDNSVRLNDNDSAGFSRTNQSSPTDAKIFTWSGWVKRGNIDTSSALFNGASGNNVSSFYFRGSGSQNYIRLVETSDNFVSYDTLIDTQMLFRDVSAWYHVVLKYDSTNGTANDRAIIYVNGVQVDLTISNTVDSNYTSPLNEGSYSNYVGRASGGNYLDGYLAEVNFIDGQALSPTDFGKFDADSGIWKPILYTGTYGTNGFYLDFENSGSLGADQSGNGNNFTPTNLASTDQTTDTPTNNFATLNPLSDSGATLSEGNTQGIGSPSSATSTIAPTSGKWYVEFQNSGLQNSSIGLVNLDAWASTTDIYPFAQAAAVLIESFSNYNVTYAGTGGGTTLQIGTQYNLSKYGFAFDLDNGDVYVSADGNWYGGSDFNQASFSNAVAVTTDIPINTPMAFFARGSFSNAYYVNFGNPPPSYSISSGNSDDNGYGNFEYAPPSGYLALCTQNLATELSPTIDDGSQYFNTILYTGTGTTQSITGVGFQPDLVWLKARTGPYYHNWYDIIRGGTKALFSNANVAEATDAGNLQTFTADGFTADGFLGTNGSGVSYVAWNWLASNSSSSNTDGSITSTVSANTTAGFSIVTYTGTGSNATVGHSLGKVPKMIIVKRRNSTSNWGGYHESIGNTSTIKLNSTDAAAPNIVFWNNTSPTSSVFTVGTSTDLNASGGTYVAYCFAEIEGYSKFGSYTANGSTDGPFFYTGFRPTFVIFKRTDGAAAWQVHDRTRETINDGSSPALKPNATDVEFSKNVDFLSNGIKIRDTSSDLNGGSGQTYIYMAFAENPFVSSTGIPVVAR